MRSRNVRTSALALALFAMASTDAAAATAMLGAANLDRLCGVDAQPGTELDRAELAALLLDRAEVPHRLRENGRASAQAAGKSGPAAELSYVIARARRSSKPRGEPFGAAGFDDDGYKKAQSRLEKQLDLLEDDFNLYRGREGTVYRLPADPPKLTAKQYFELDGRAVITCHGKPKTAGEKPGDAPGATGVHFRLAQSARGLAGPVDSRAKDLGDVDPAEFSFVNNVEDDSSVFGIDGAAGMLFQPGGIDGKWQVLGFAEYKRQSPGGASKKEDIHKVAPGASLIYRDNLAHIGTVPLPYSLTLSPRLLFDLEQDSSQATVDVTGEPSFPLFGNLQVGSYGSIGPLWIRPDIVLRGRAASVLDSGTDGDLQGADDYLAVGGLADLQFRLPFVTPFENFTLGLSFDHLQFVAGDLRRDNANRFEAALSYTPPEYQTMVVRLQYANGEDMDTFQREESYSLAVGLRY